MILGIRPEDITLSDAGEVKGRSSWWSRWAAMTCSMCTSTRPTA